MVMGKRGVGIVRGTKALLHACAPAQLHSLV